MPLIKFELTAFIMALLLIGLIRLLLTLWQPNLLADGNLLVLVIFPLIGLMLLFNIGYFSYRLFKTR